MSCPERSAAVSRCELIDANGSVKTTTFDAAGRVVSLLYADGKRVTFQYDAGNRRTTMVDWDGTTTYAYSARGELTGKTVPGGWSLTIVYDSVGNRATLIETTGYAYTYGYDALNRCIRLRDPNAYVFTFQYDAAGRRTTLLDSTGVSRVYAFDPVGRLTTQVDYDPSSTPIVTFVDGYDAVGNRTSRIKDGVATTWVCDSIYRLTAQQQSGQAATFVYDASGNITAKHHQVSEPMTMTFDAANRLVTTQQGSTLGTYTFDANGNMTVEQVAGSGLLNTFVYDEENRLLNEIRASGARHTYTYEPDGLRRSAFHAGTASVVTFIWDGDDLLNERIEGANAARYAVLDGEALSEKRGASRYRFVPDPLGSVRGVLDTSGVVVATRDYYPYGEVAAQSGGMTAIQFVGALGYFTDTTNRVYIRARHYRPDLGRWVTRDPMAPGEDEASPYEYAGGTPFVAVDPSGLAPRVTKCTGGTENAIRLGCDCLSSLGAEILARVNACVRSHTRVYHTPCPDMTAAQMSCLAGFCADHCGAVYCVRRDDPATCLADLCGEHCGFTIPGTREGGCGAVYLCYPAHQTRQCRTFGCGSPTAFSMFHEVIHRCRYDQDDPIWAEDCIDFAARCIYEACVGHGVRLPVDPVTGTACPG